MSDYPPTESILIATYAGMGSTYSEIQDRHLAASKVIADIKTDACDEGFGEGLESADAICSYCLDRAAEFIDEDGDSICRDCSDPIETRIRMSGYTVAEFEALESVVYDFFKQYGENWADYDLTFHLMKRGVRYVGEQDG